MLYLTILLGAILFAGIAMTVQEGLWSNTILLFLVILAGLMAVVAGVPLGTWGRAQAGQDADTTWYFVFASMWGVFFLSLAVMRILAERISPTKMRFLPLLDKVGGPLMGLLVAIMFTSFAAFTLWQVPITSGAYWQPSDASATQKTVFAYAQAPFYNVAQSFLKSEQASSPLVSAP